MSGRAGFRKTFLPIATAIVLLDACSTSGIRQDRVDELADLGRIYAEVAATPPAQSELVAGLGAPTVHHLGDLTFETRAGSYEQLRALHAQARKATDRARKAADTAEPAEPLDPASAAVLVLLAPIWVPSALLAIPLAGADIAVGHAIVATEDDPRPRQMAGRSLLVAYGPDGSYRWQACCVLPNFTDEKGPTVRFLPDPNALRGKNGATIVPHAYRSDYIAVECYRALAGDVTTQGLLFDRFNRWVPDPVQAYYWAKIAGESDSGLAKARFERVRAALDADSIRSAETYYRAHPLDEVDCLAVSAQVIAAEDAGSQGPQM
jgi:hypothetical protein